MGGGSAGGERVGVEKGRGWRGWGGIVNLHGLLKAVWHDIGTPRIFPFTLEDSVRYVT